MLHCKKSVNDLEHGRILQKLPTIEQLLSKEEQIVFFNKTMLLPTLQRQPKSGLRTIRLMFLPSQSPDLNPIENWSHIKLQL